MRMRWAGLWVGAILAVVLAGCGGGPAAPAVRGGEPEPELLTMHYFHRKLTLPRADGTESYQLTTRVWEAQDAPLHAGLRVAMPYPEKTPRPSGPLLPGVADGTNTLGAPVRLFWGEGETAGAGQPIVTPHGQWLPGYRRPRADLYQYNSLLLLDGPIPVAGSYSLTDGDALVRAWTVPPGLEMLMAVEVAEPSLVVNSRKPMMVRWRPVPGAAGYLVTIEGDLRTVDGTVATRVIWTSAPQPMTIAAVYDVTPYLLPPTTRQVTAPANLFRGCETVMINVLAVATPFEDTTAKPTVRIHSASLASHLVVTYQQ